MNRTQIKKCRENEIRRLADRFDGDFAKATSLYNRCVRFTLRWYRWATIDVSENLKGYQRELHLHERDLLHNVYAKLTSELEPYGLHFDFNGLYPTIYDKHNNHGPELFWY